MASEESWPSQFNLLAVDLGLRNTVFVLVSVEMELEMVDGRVSAVKSYLPRFVRSSKLDFGPKYATDAVGRRIYDHLTANPDYFGAHAVLVEKQPAHSARNLAIAQGVFSTLLTLARCGRINAVVESVDPNLKIRLFGTAYDGPEVQLPESLSRYERNKATAVVRAQYFARKYCDSKLEETLRSLKRKHDLADAYLFCIEWFAEKARERLEGLSWGEVSAAAPTQTWAVQPMEGSAACPHPGFADWFCSDDKA